MQRAALGRANTASLNSEKRGRTGDSLEKALQSAQQSGDIAARRSPGRPPPDHSITQSMTRMRRSTEKRPANLDCMSARRRSPSESKYCCRWKRDKAR